MAVSRLRMAGWIRLALLVGIAPALFTVLPKPQYNAALAAPAQASDYAGLYVATLPLIDFRRVSKDEVYGVREAEGVYIRMVWNTIEPAPGRYDWSLLDFELEKALKAGKKISVSVIAGGYAPEWLWDKGAQNSTFVVGQGGGANRRCRNLKLGWPWDPVYQDAFVAMMKALAQHLRDVPGAYEAVRIVKLTGINQITEELRLPSGDGTQRGMPDPCLSDATQLWRTAGYKPSLLVQAWNKIAVGINEAFPDKLLATDILDRNDFPPIGENGGPVRIPKVKDEIIRSGISRFPSRYAVQWNGLSAERVSTVVEAAGRAGAVIGWQTNAFRGRDGAGCNVARAEPAQTCDDQRYLAILDRGIAAGGKYIEIWQADALAFRGALAKATEKLRSQR